MLPLHTSLEMHFQVRPDFSDVSEVIKALQRNQTLAQSIAEAGQMYMSQFGSKEHEMKVAVAVFRLYASILIAARKKTKVTKNERERKIEKLLYKSARIQHGQNFPLKIGASDKLLQGAHGEFTSQSD